MDAYKKLIILGLLCLLPSVSLADGCSSKLIDWSDYDSTLNKIRVSYHSADYQAIDGALFCLLKSKNTFSSGKPGSVAAYWFFRKELKAPGASEEDLGRIKKWQKASPDSGFAKFAELRYSYAQAWNARGSKYANDTREDQLNRFKQKLLETEALILSDYNSLQNTPISYNLLMAVTLDTKGTKSSAMDVFNDGVANWPRYYDFYEVLLTRMVPKWGGSWEQVDGFINYWASILEAVEGDSIYARFYHNVHKHNRIDPRLTLVEWPRLKASLDSLYSKYPVLEHYAIAASYACIFADQEFYRSVASNYDVSASQYWFRGTSESECESYFNSLPGNLAQ